jgi:uncharacterized protein YraI
MMLLALLLVTTLATPAAAETYRSATTGNVNLRAGPGIDHERLATLSRGTEVFIDHCRQGWCLVDSLGVVGWVSAKYLGGTGVVEPYYPPVVRAPPVATFDFVVPRNYHDFGYAHEHKPSRDLHGLGR